MHNYSFLSLILLFFLASSSTSFAQDAKNDIMVVRYESSPKTQYNTKLNADGSSRDADDLMSTIREHCTLYINMRDRSSLYRLDSMTHDLPPGQSPATGSNVYWILKSSDQRTYKSEALFDQTFFTKGKTGDIEWKLVDDTKVINGLKCHKAVSKNKEWMLTVWYTKEVPISNGPSIYQGLPGLVVWAEDFFWTTELINIEYRENDQQQSYQTTYNSHLASFEDKKNDKFRSKESLLLLKKSEAALSYYKLIHGKPFAY